jgi:BirA family biotin operon repressor/biotin-[acetyl-CoA-carboxylase] ligase
LTFSLILRPPFAPHWLVMASALAAADAIEMVTGIRPGIKWPNDVLIGERKVCGILIETSGDFAVLGIGLNVNGSLAGHPQLAARATTLADATGHTVSREALAAELLCALAETYARLCAGGELAQRELRATWRGRLVMLGRRVAIRQEAREQVGLAEDVGTDGALLLRDDAGTLHAITWGDVE